MTWRYTGESGPCRIASIAHPNKPIVRYVQISWMGDYRWNRSRCETCLRSVYKQRKRG